ncbi:MAG: phytoene desaturase, partial [Silvanigrellaceae bacterium]|nr:phytoene desaturase [Silvanigrellaceae bacterium]
MGHKCFDVAVIGAGFGGLATALSLQNSGLSVALVDSLDKVGGRAYSEHHKPGYIFDRGPSIITAPFLIDDLFTKTKARREDYCKFVPVDPYYKVIFHDGSEISHFHSFEKLLAEVKKISPEDEQGVKDFFCYADKIFQTGFVKLGDKYFSNTLSMVGVAPNLLRLNAIRPVYKAVSQFVKHEKLRQFLSFHPLLIGGNPFHTCAVYSLINSLERAYGIYHPVGGMHVLAQGIQKRFAELGGETFLSQPIEKIDQDNENLFHLTSSKGENLRAKKIVVNADMGHFVKNVLSGRAKPVKLAKKLASAKYSMSAFLMYFGTKKQWPELAQHSIILGPRYKELLDDIFKT